MRFFLGYFTPWAINGTQKNGWASVCTCYSGHWYFHFHSCCGQWLTVIKPPASNQPGPHFIIWAFQTILFAWPCFIATHLYSSPGWSIKENTGNISSYCWPLWWSCLRATDSFLSCTYPVLATGYGITLFSICLSLLSSLLAVQLSEWSKTACRKTSERKKKKRKI